MKITFTILIFVGGRIARPSQKPDGSFARNFGLVSAAGKMHIHCFWTDEHLLVFVVLLLEKAVDRDWVSTYRRIGNLFKTKV